MPTFVQRLPNGGSVPGVRALGHVNPNGGGATNDFGEAFEAAGTQWTPQLCQADSDGDGATNGEELGDPCCTWQPGGAVSRTTSITHPGVANTFSPAELSAMRCAAAAGATTGGTQDAAPGTAPPTAPVQPVVDPSATAQPDTAIEVPVAADNSTPPVVPSAPTDKMLTPPPPRESKPDTTTAPASGTAPLSSLVTAAVVLAASAGVVLL